MTKWPIMCWVQHHTGLICSLCNFICWFLISGEYIISCWSIIVASVVCFRVVRIVYRNIDNQLCLHCRSYLITLPSYYHTVQMDAYCVGGNFKVSLFWSVYIFYIHFISVQHVFVASSRDAQSKQWKCMHLFRPSYESMIGMLEEQEIKTRWK